MISLCICSCMCVQTEPWCTFWGAHVTLEAKQRKYNFTHSHIHARTRAQTHAHTENTSTRVHTIHAGHISRGTHRKNTNWQCSNVHLVRAHRHMQPLSYLLLRSVLVSFRNLDLLGQATRINCDQRFAPHTPFSEIGASTDLGRKESAAIQERVWT